MAFWMSHYSRLGQGQLPAGLVVSEASLRACCWQVRRPPFLEQLRGEACGGPEGACCLPHLDLSKLLGLPFLPPLACRLARALPTAWFLCGCLQRNAEDKWKRGNRG